MTRTIWKFTLDPQNLSVVMPHGAQVLTAREQLDQICIWAEIDPEQYPEERRFAVYGTGHAIDIATDRQKYIGTTMIHGGALVFHVYELLP